MVRLLRHTLCSSDRSVPSVSRAFPDTGVPSASARSRSVGIVERGEAMNTGPKSRRSFSKRRPSASFLPCALRFRSL
jgi:hypothetical protein